MKLINQSASTASRMSGWAVALLLGAFLLGGSTTDATAAAQPPYIGAFYFFSSNGGTHESTVNSTNYTCQAWEIQLGTPSILCDKIFWQVTRDSTLYESTTSYGPTTSDDWVLYDSGTGGSTRSIIVKTFYDDSDPFYNSYYITYEDSYYSRCVEEGGSVYIYNP
jgi:hypothetical protein